jgi:hypothetical protein
MGSQCKLPYTWSAEEEMYLSGFVYIQFDIVKACLLHFIHKVQFARALTTIAAV